VRTVVKGSIEIDASDSHWRMGTAGLILTTILVLGEKLKFLIRVFFLLNSSTNDLPLVCLDERGDYLAGIEGVVDFDCVLSVVGGGVWFLEGHVIVLLYFGFVDEGAI
jgi:hypothetical protein